MRYNVGIDFGTHQTKVCIEDALNKRVPVYEFLEYSKPNGNKTVLLPSIVQINKDHTVSFGFADPADALIVVNDGNTPPEKEIIPEPQYRHIPSEPKYESLPKRPESKNTGYLAVLEKLLPISETMKKWKQECASVERANEYRKQAWLNSKREAERANEQLRKEWEQRVKVAEEEYRQQYAEWEKDVQQSAQMRFRYFKQASFYPNSTPWHYSYAPETLSTLYLAYVCLCIRNRIGYDFTVQLGAPMGANKRLSDQQKSAAKRIWNKSVYLANHYQSIDNYLLATIEELMDVLSKFNFLTSPSSVIPEASAGLLAIREKLGAGMFLLVDIGGGTTDIAMCSVYHTDGSKEKTVGIHRVLSVNKGLNYIFEEYQKLHPRLSIADIQEIFRKSQEKSDFAQPIDTYQQELYNLLAKMVKQIIDAFMAKRSQHGKNRSEVIQAMTNKPIYLCGGGSVYAKMRGFSTTNIYFSDKTPINKTLLNIEHLGNAGNIPDEIYPIVATAYGLSKQVDIEEELDEQPLEAFFNHLPKNTDQTQERTPDNDFRLAMGTW